MGSTPTASTILWAAAARRRLQTLDGRRLTARRSSGFESRPCPHPFYARPRYLGTHNGLSFGRSSRPGSNPGDGHTLYEGPDAGYTKPPDLDKDKCCGATYCYGDVGGACRGGSYPPPLTFYETYRTNGQSVHPVRKPFGVGWVIPVRIRVGLLMSAALG